MPDQLRDRLQASLGAAYALERELGGGGMSRVFLATDPALGRQVVVKVLSAEAVEGMSAERFTREIRLAAALQDPHIAPVLTAGDTACARRVAEGAMRELPANGVRGELESNAIGWTVAPGDARLRWELVCPGSGRSTVHVTTGGDSVTAR